MDSIQDNEDKGKDVKNNIPSFKLHDPVTVLNTSLMTTSDNCTPSCNQDNSLSFVILGKDSMDAEAQASLLASYVDIRQKSMSIVRIAVLFYCISYSSLMNKKLKQDLFLL